LAVLALLVVLTLVLPVTNLFISPSTGTPLTRAAAGDPAWLAVAGLLEQNCLDCHAREHAHGTALPYYARLPVASSLMEADRTQGVRYLDMTRDLVPADGQPVSEVAIAKLEYALERGTMPPGRYVLLHWDRGLSKSERKTALDWIRSLRRQHYRTEGVAEPFAVDALQPLPQSLATDEKKVALGRKLFHDVRLSADNTLSCASCHGLDKGGTDQVKSSTGIGGAIGPINSPTVFNSVFNVRQFWDGRAADLQEQAAGPVANPIEMGSNFEQVVQKLGQDQAFVAEFESVYPAGLSEDTITHAIAEFERTLVTPNSRFDRYLMGQANALTPDELEGLRLFRENACATCHAGKALGGVSFERLGRRRDYFGDRGELTEVDHGRFNVTKDEADRHAFKVPTLRNVALTYPYFHDGSQATLEAAVASMARYQAYRDFSVQETQRVVAFLNTLTGEYEGRPLQ
jgi:cytochrome c peroxidase